MVVDTRYRAAYVDASWRPFWLDRADRPGVRAPLEVDRTADLVIIGAGFTGLWAAVQALEDLPGREVVVLEGERIAFGGSGRNGGFCDRSLTHGRENGRSRFPHEIERIEREGRENFEGIADTIAREGIDCSWEPSGTLIVATAPHAVPWCASAVESLTRFGYDAELLDRDGVQAELGSPTFLAGFWRR